MTTYLWIALFKIRDELLKQLNEIIHKQRDWSRLADFARGFPVFVLLASLILAWLWLVINVPMGWFLFILVFVVTFGLATGLIDGYVTVPPTPEGEQ